MAINAFSPHSSAQRIQSDLACFEVAACIWSPAAMCGQRFLGADARITILVAIIWAFLLGYVAGRAFARTPADDTPRRAGMSG
jgi:Na+-translocating ferredoxin:NAD+ oxidoreductase RnfD subunit